MASVIPFLLTRLPSVCLVFQFNRTDFRGFPYLCFFCPPFDVSVFSVTPDTVDGGEYDPLCFGTLPVSRAVTPTSTVFLSYGARSRSFRCIPLFTLTDLFQVIPPLPSH